ncbi:hypothetical protein OQA88_9185 [Cercophora sp. LCS_1]
MLKPQVEAGMELFRHHRATDPRDKVYGLLALVRNWHGGVPLVPDHTKPVEQVYTDVVVKILRDRRSADLLCRPPDLEEDKRLEGLPSWVPDFSQGVMAGTALERMKSMMPLNGAAKELETQRVEVYDIAPRQGKVLAMKAVQVDLLRRVSTPMVA